MMAIDLKGVIIEEMQLSSDGSVYLSAYLHNRFIVKLFSLKLICSGKVLQDNESLDSQGVKNGQQIMAIVLVESPTEVVEKESQIKELENTKTDSKLLALDDEYMRVKRVKN